MYVVPAVGLGLFVVFLVGAGVTYVVLEQITKRKKANPSLYWDPLRKVEPDYLTEDKIGEISLVAGGFTVVLMILSLFVIPRE